MSLDLHFELRLEERLQDRVFVSVVLAPAPPTAGAAVEGVAVQIQSRTGEALGTRLLLPISGAIAQPMVTTVELRSRGEIPTGARVIGTAWFGTVQREAACPCDPGTQLEVHMRGRRTVSLEGEGDGLRSLDRDERAILARLMPWVNEPMVPRVEAHGVLESPDAADAFVDQVVEQFDLCDEDAAFLRELLDEE